MKWCSVSQTSSKPSSSVHSIWSSSRADDVGVPVARRRLEEEVGAEAHQATPR